MKTALIGYTGFVGSNIYRQKSFDELYNSKNIDQVVDRSFDLVVCAGVPAVKWWANQNPCEDLSTIKRLAETYKRIKAKRFVLISTVDVYPVPRNVDESSKIEVDEISPYGKNRLWLERELEGVFENYHVVRLPGLFGVGLKKNILFDLLCENILEKINLKSSFQWYPLSRVWQDIETIISNNLPLVNLAVEPISNFKIKEQFFNDLNVGCEPLPEVHYDMHTSFSGKFKSQHNNYLLTADEVLNELSVWLEKPEVKCE